MTDYDLGHERDPASGEISSDEVILRRLPRPLPGNPATTIERPSKGLTATSFALKPRLAEKYPSWSRRKFTSPQKLLRLAADQGHDTAGWSVAAAEVEEVRKLGLDVVPRPTAEDPGHCEIVPGGLEKFTDSIWSKLAKRTHVVYQEPPVAD